jgi:hypothetical protein
LNAQKQSTPGQGKKQEQIVKREIKLKEPKNHADKRSKKPGLFSHRRVETAKGRFSPDAFPLPDSPDFEQRAKTAAFQAFPCRFSSGKLHAGVMNHQ